MSLVTEGECRYCQCSEASPCWYCRQHHDGVSFYDKHRTVCAQPSCVSKYEIALADAKRVAKRQRLNSAQVHELIRRGNRKRKGRAA